MFCHNCKSPVPEDVAVCPVCESSVNTDTAPTTKKRKIKGWILGIIIGAVAFTLTIAIFFASVCVIARISYINHVDVTAAEEVDVRAFYSCACAGFTKVASSGPVEEDVLYQTTFDLIGNSSIDQSECIIEFDESGIISVSIPCSEGGMLTYNGSYFSGGGANHNHGE